MRFLLRVVILAWHPPSNWTSDLSAPAPSWAGCLTFPCRGYSQKSAETTTPVGVHTRHAIFKWTKHSLKLFSLGWRRGGKSFYFFHDKHEPNPFPFLADGEQKHAISGARDTSTPFMAILKFAGWTNWNGWGGGAQNQFAVVQLHLNLSDNQRKTSKICTDP